MDTVVPWPSALAMSTVPPSDVTMASTTARPMPDPRTALCALKNFWRTLSRSSGGMPRPWSRTATTTAAGVRDSVKKMAPPGGEYLMALSSTLMNTCRRRAGSAQTG